MKLFEQAKNDIIRAQSIFRQKNLDEESFCIMPFVNIILEPDGHVGVCRHKGASLMSIGNLNNQTIEEIWKSELAIAWRRDFSEGKKIICKEELFDRRCNLCPELNKLLPYAETSNIYNPRILRLTANLNGKCNLECQMCTVWKMPNGYYTEENFWKPARNLLFKVIMEMDLLSGEPFIQKDTYRLIDEISEINPACNWTFTTNLHWNLTNIIKEKLNKIIIKNIIVSIDSLIPDIYGKIRKRGNLEFVLSNLERFIQYEEERVDAGLSRLNIRFNALIQQDNWHEVGDIIKFCTDKNIFPFITFLYKPHHLSLLSLDYSARIEILNHYLTKLSSEEIKLSLRIFKPLLKSLSKIDYTYFSTEIIKIIKSPTCFQDDIQNQPY